MSLNLQFEQVGACLCMQPHQNDELCKQKRKLSNLTSNTMTDTNTPVSRSVVKVSLVVGTLYRSRRVSHDSTEWAYRCLTAEF